MCFLNVHEMSCYFQVLLYIFVYLDFSAELTRCLIRWITYLLEARIFNFEDIFTSRQTGRKNQTYENFSNMEQEVATDLEIMSKNVISKKFGLELREEGF